MCNISPLPSRSLLLWERWWHSNERVIFFTSASPRRLIIPFFFVCFLTNARTHGGFGPIKVTMHAQTRTHTRTQSQRHKRVDGAITDKLLTSRNGEESQQQQRHPAVHHLTERALSPKGVHRDGEATPSTPAVLTPLLLLTTTRTFSLYLAWWRQGSPSVHTFLLLLKRIEKIYNISAGELCDGSHWCCQSVLNTAQRCDALGRRGRRSDEGGEGRGGEDVAYLRGSTANDASVFPCTKSHITIEYSALLGTYSLFVVLIVTL